MKAKYANKITVSNSLYETRIEFEIESPKDNNEIELEKVADIRMSPQLAKKLRDILAQSVDGYEQAMGTIPDDMTVEKG